MWVRVRSYLGYQCDTWLWFLTPAWKWISRFQRPLKTPTIISITSGGFENSWARKLRARLYMHLSHDRSITTTVWWMDYQIISPRNLSVCITHLPRLVLIWENMITWILHSYCFTGFQSNIELNSKHCGSSSKDFMARHLATPTKWPPYQKAEDILWDPMKHVSWMFPNSSVILSPRSHSQCIGIWHGIACQRN